MSTPSGLWDKILWNQGTFGGGALDGLGGIVAGRLIYAALRKAGVTLGPQRTPSPAQQKDGIEELNRLMGSLSLDRYFVYTLDLQTLPLQAGKKSYTIGQSSTGVPADFSVPWPIKITMANVITSNGAQPLREPLTVYTAQQWADIAIQDLSGAIPVGIYWDRGYPVGNLYVYGQPATAMQLELWTWHQIPQAASEDDLMFLPPGYDDCLVLNLACRLAPHFQRMVDADVREQARLSLMRVLSINAPRPIATLGGLG